MRSLTPNLDQDNDSLYKLNLLIALSRKCTQHTCSIYWPATALTDSFFFGQALAEILSPRIWIAGWFRQSTSVCAVVALQANLNSKLKEAMDSPCQEDRLIREMVRGSELVTVAVHLYGVLQVHSPRRPIAFMEPHLPFSDLN